MAGQTVVHAGDGSARVTKEIDALDRLLAVAQSDTGQSRRVANFLLAWWNARSCGGFDLTDLWMLDEQIVDDIITVTGLIASSHAYADALGYEEHFRGLVEQWRPQLCTAE